MLTTGDVSISKTGVNAGGQKVTNVKAGEISAASTDAVNGSQLHETNLNVANNATKIKQMLMKSLKAGTSKMHKVMFPT